MTKKKDEETEIVVRAEECIMEHRTNIKASKASKVKRFFSSTRYLMYDALSGSVLRYFRSVNRKARSEVALWSMRLETHQHLYLTIKVFKWTILPASLLYVCADFFYFGENALDSMFLGILIFFYSTFLPDFPSIFRRKACHNARDMAEDLGSYKKYALLLFAPLFIIGFLCGVRLKWKTTETFHNSKSAIIYGAFLFALGIFAFGDFPISIGDLTEMLSLPFYGLAGYLTHLKVDLCL